MLGPYYRPQITSVLSITSRLTGIWLSVVTAPMLIIWLGTLVSGPELFESYEILLGSLPGRLVSLVSLFCFNFHLLNGIRHLAWDLGKGFELSTVRLTGWLVLLLSLLVTGALWMAGS